ncbi:MAG: hypothetical protein WCJ33_05660, partial [Pseudomonadota bacterium]
NLEGYPKEPGVFSQSPNYLYKTKSVLNKDNTYKLVISKNDGNTITATTTMVDNIKIVKPDTIIAISMLPQSNQKYIATWKNTKNAKFYGLTIRFFYTEFTIGNPADSVKKSFDWKVFSDYIPDNNSSGSNAEFTIFTSELYQQLANNIPVNNNVNRIVRGTQFTYAAGGNELYTYYLVNQSKNGITAGQITPDYTNISDGLGLFSSRSFKVVPKVNLKPATIDSIACNKLTQKLNFFNSQGQVCP